MPGAPTSAIYERELKGVLGGDDRVTSGLLKSLDGSERDAYATSARTPFLVVRAAGSLGADLVALRSDLSFLIEVKSSKKDLLHFTDSPRLTEQIQVIRAQCERSGVLPMYAFRLKGVRGDAWRLFTLSGMKLDGCTARLYERLPKVELTAAGNHVLRWKNGMSLAGFLRYVNPAAPAAAPASPAIPAAAPPRTIPTAVS